jgi:nitroreductase
MDVETAIRTRRTHKAFAPDHNLTVPWRFRVIGPQALRGLKEVAGPEGAAKLDRAPTLIVVSCVLSGDPVEEEEDLHATATASYIVLLAAHARGLAGYWRTPGILRSDEGRAAVGLPAEERFVGLLHLGHPRQRKPPPERPGADRTTTYLD